MGDVSGNTELLKQYTADANLALDDLFTIGFNASGSWQLDDSNQTDYPEIKTNLVSGQRDYAFTTDGSGNLILYIYRVEVANSSGVFSEIFPVDSFEQDNNLVNTDSFIDGKNTTGTPTRYSKTANALLLDPIPSYNSSSGLKIQINREPSYFLYTDTTKKPGIPGNLHRYLAIKPAFDLARRTNAVNYQALAIEVKRLEDMIISVFGSRQKDVRSGMTANYEDCK